MDLHDVPAPPSLQVRVNGREVLQGQSATLPHLSLLEAGRVQLVFAVNAGAVRRCLHRSRAAIIGQDAEA